MVKLRTWQEHALKAIKLNGYKAIVVAGTGSGKSIVGTEVVKRLQTTTLIIVPKITLVHQWYDVLRDEGIEPEQIGFYYGEVKDMKPITIAVINSVHDVIQLDKKFDLLILDEVHRYASTDSEGITGKWTNLLLNNRFKYSLGLTATLTRTDGAHDLLIDKVGPVVYEYNFKDALKDSVVSPFKIVCVGLDITSEEELLWLEKIDNEIKSGMVRYNSDLNEVLNCVKNRDWNAARLMKKISQRKQFLANHFDKALMAAALIFEHKNEKIIVFGEYIESIDYLYTLLVDAGVKPYVYYSGNKTAKFKFSNKDKIEIIQNFTKEEKGVLLSVKALEEGTDVPDLQIGIVISGNRISRQAIQRMGRLVRKQEGKEAIMYYLYFRDTMDKNAAKMFCKNFEGIVDVEWR